MNILKMSLIFVTMAVFAASCSKPEPISNPLKSDAASPTPAQPQITAAVNDADAGKELYAANCMICHKDSGKGGKVTMAGKNLNAEDLTTDKMKKMSDDKLQGYVTDGIPDEGMPAFKDKLAPDEITTVVKYIRTLQK